MVRRYDHNKVDVIGGRFSGHKTAINYDCFDKTNGFRFTNECSKLGLQLWTSIAALKSRETFFDLFKRAVMDTFR